MLFSKLRALSFGCGGLGLWIHGSIYSVRLGIMLCRTRDNQGYLRQVTGGEARRGSMDGGVRPPSTLDPKPKTNTSTSPKCYTLSAKS